MKMVEEFVLLLADAAIEFLRAQKSFSTQKLQYVFEGVEYGEPISDNRMRMALKKIGYDGIMDIYGFRSSLRTILSELNVEEKLGCSKEVLSLCIDHRLRNVVKSDQSYQIAKFEKAKRDIFEYWHSKIIEWGAQNFIKIYRNLILKYKK